MDELYKPTDPSSMNLKHKKHEENITVIKLLKTYDKEKILKAARGKSPYYFQKSRYKGIRFLSGTKASDKTS